MRRGGFRRRAHRKAYVMRAKFYPAHWLAMCLRHRQKTFDQSSGYSPCQGFQGMQRWRHSEHFRIQPLFVGASRCDPFTLSQFPGHDVWFLFGRTINQKKPGVEAAQAKWRCHPAAGKREVVGVKMKVVM